MAKQLPATQQYAPATLEALRNATSDYAYWHKCQDFAQAQRQRARAVRGPHQHATAPHPRACPL